MATDEREFRTPTASWLYVPVAREGAIRSSGSARQKPA